MTDVFSPVRIGAWDLPNRLVMAPLTRNRADEYGVHGDLGVAYYSQRASAGLIITEGAQPSLVGQGYTRTAGFHSADQIAAWQRVTDAVHGNGGRIVAQLMHAGRVAHPDNKQGAETVAPSALAAPGQIFTPNGQQDYPTPRALEESEIADVVEEFAQAARNAIKAGLDGVEVHGANGYLIHQFLAPGSNERTDGYGGSPEARARFGVEVVAAVVDAIGADRVGLRISPAHNIQGATEEDPADVEATYTAFLSEIAPLGIAYVSVLTAEPEGDLAKQLHELTTGAWLVNTGFGSVTTKADAERVLADGADAVVVGREFLANPDLVKRWAEDLPLNEPDADTFYAVGPKGYTDYPFADGTVEHVDA